MCENRAESGTKSVTIRTSNGPFRYDLQGASHYSKSAGADVPKPHVQAYRNNVIPSGPRAGQDGDVRPVNNADLRAVEKALDKRDK